MSSESRPVLSRAVPAFELFMTAWENLRDSNKHMKPFILVGLYWANHYYGRMDNTRAYVIAMCKSLFLLALQVRMPTFTHHQWLTHIYNSAGLKSSGRGVGF